jgi:ABC-type polysaccharide/polyol phosphate transport system ATPase subunit
VGDSYSKVNGGVTELGVATTTEPTGAIEEGHSTPTEEVNESLMGAPTVVISHLRKTFSSGQKAVNDLSFNMYENQIFALLGHNGAGKVCLH